MIYKKTKNIQLTPSSTFVQPAADKKKASGPGIGRNATQQPQHLKRGDQPTSGTNFDALLSNIDKLFAEKVEYFGDVEMSRAPIMSAIVKIVIKVRRNHCVIKIFSNPQIS
jgi:hypothetical protein